MSRRLGAEFLGTFWLVFGGAGSAIFAAAFPEVGIGLLGVSLAFGLTVVTMAYAVGHISGGHFNPAVTLTFLIRREISLSHAALYVIVQIVAGLFGVFIAHVMFGEPIFSSSLTARTGIGVWTGEFVATFGLIATILGCLRFRPEAVPYAVGLFITAGYWFTSSTSFANPAVTICLLYTSDAADE